ncbi:twin-arginine translocase subunit TatC [Miltoncostaea marina]|uniref:twin-arginine translocase subunit TatC n=1 Tax=Miltoncostaea marina TaxID=2843215 RepID=UPI001C3D5F40|nr:twin-arginine translocase subunit TatC [Miltoncostaea marina]
MALRGRLRRVAPEERLSVVDHLDELRTRLIVAVLALVVAFGVAYGFHEQLIDFLEQPLPDRFEHSGLITLSPTEPFFTTLKVCFWTAIIAAVPVWLYQVYAFVIPAVQDQPRRRMLAVVAGASALFLAGVAFGYWVVLPVALDFLLGFGDDTFLTQVRAGEYFGFVTTLMFASGLMFEVPVAMLALARIGVASAELYIAQWRVALVAIAALAAILPGGDPFSMLLLMLPQILLYGLGILLARRFGGPPLWAREAWADAEEASPRAP